MVGFCGGNVRAALGLSLVVCLEVAWSGVLSCIETSLPFFAAMGGASGSLVGLNCLESTFGHSGREEIYEERDVWMASWQADKYPAAALFNDRCDFK